MCSAVLPRHAKTSRIDPARLAPVREFRARPIGQHSPELMRILSILRSGDVEGKYCLICIRPHAEWVIGRLSGRRGVPPAIEDNRVLTSIKEAEWVIFKLRWAQECGVTLDEDAL